MGRKIYTCCFYCEWGLDMKKKYLIAKLVTRGRIENLIAFFWGVAIFLLPFNVFLVFWQPPFAIQGSFNIYENFVV